MGDYTHPDSEMVQEHELAHVLAKLSHHYRDSMDAFADHDQRKANHELLEMYLVLDAYLMEDEDDA